MELPTPPGYRKLTPFDRERHRGLRVRRERPHAFAGGLNAIPVVAAEFIQAGRHYPIVFAQDRESGQYTAAAVTGIRSGENVFVDNEGRWDSNLYVPAYVRRWPFYGVRMPDGKEQRLLICVDEEGLEAGEPPLIRDDGDHGAGWEGIERLVTDLDAAARQTDQLIRFLRERELLEPFEAHGVPDRPGGRDFHLRGMLRINESRLNGLDGKTVKRLMKQGQLSRIYAHLMSLENFRGLLDRANPDAARKDPSFMH